MNFKAVICLLLVVIAVASAMPGRDYDRSREDFGSYRSRDRSYERRGRYEQEDDDDEEDRSYEFRYQVADESEELDFGHEEEKSSGEVEGYYYVLLPDSRILHVKYTAGDDSGFDAEVHFEGSAEYESSENDRDNDDDGPRYGRRYRDSREKY